jgi:serine/threonine protein kinase
MVPDKRDEEEIFHAAIAQPEDQRHAYLRKACADDSELLAHIQAMLQSYDARDNFLESPPLTQNVTFNDSDLEEAPGTVIGRYKLLEKIGEGGMAVVYMAEQEKPIRRKVALKIIKLGMDTKLVIARFEAERQALALMDHPSIAKVLDAGATETGRPYFVMELVTGVSITEYCNQNSLSAKQRLSLFIQVCNAIQHAHQKGIIHRDIKPTNVMVTQHEGTPVPKIIDFGIAKATNQRLTEKTLFTRYAHIIGTPAYMSPEQAELSDFDIDTRSDIYSLGVLLYELLTGTTPFSEDELRRVGYAEMTRIIREQEPLRPSTRLTQMQARTSPQIQNPKAKIENDLDWIVMKSLEKTRDRRYDNASALALDVQRHLDDQPVFARAPSVLYRLQKFLRRNCLQVGAASVVVLFTCVTVCMLWLWRDKLRHGKSEAAEDEQALMDLDNNLIDNVRRQRLGDALAQVTPLLDSKHVGAAARVLHQRIQDAVRQFANSYTQKIAAEPNNADHYFGRAQQHYWLGEMDKMQQDFDRYTRLLNPPVGTEAYTRQFATLSTQQTGSGFVFGMPVNIGPPVNTIYGEYGSSISADGRTLYFCDGGPWPRRSGQHGSGDLWGVSRETVDDPWQEPVNLGSVVNSPYPESSPCIAADGLTLYFSTSRPGGFGDADLYVSRRAALDLPWGEPVNLGAGVNSSSTDFFPFVSEDGLTLYFCSKRSGEGDIYRATRADTNGPFGPAENNGSPINTKDSDESTPWLASNGLALIFTSKRTDKRPYTWNLYISYRRTTEAPWEEPIDLGWPVSTWGGQSGASFTADGSRFFFYGDHVGGFGYPDIWEAPVLRMPRGFSIQGKND